MPKLSLRSLARTFGDHVAVDGVNLDLAAGEFVSLLGPSGCGKTTMLRMIAGFIDPSAGSIAVDDKVISSPEWSLPPAKRQMSMIFQSYALWPNMTVAENVAFGLKLRKLSISEVTERVNRILTTVRLGPLADRYPAELSGGQQQRVALARAIVINPAVLLLDEPLSNLDANLREEMRFEIRRLHNEFKFTTVYVTHDQSEAMVTSDRIVVMNQGHIEQVDTPFELYSRPRTRFVAGFIGRTNFIEGRLEGSNFRFESLRADISLFNLSDSAASQNVTFSVRPQNISLQRACPSADGRLILEGEVADRSYLGESWDYAVRPIGWGLQLKVSAPPFEIHEVGQAVWLSIDPQHMIGLI